MRRNNIPITRSSLHRIIHDVLSLYPYRIQRKNKLQPADLGRCLAFCRWVLRRRHIQFLIGDEAQFLLNGKVLTQNVRCYSPKGNPPANFQYETDRNNKQSVRVWAGVIDNNIIGPFFYAGNMNSQRYINMVVNQIVPSLQQLGYRQGRCGIYFPGLFYIQDGAPCHTSHQSRAVLEQYFPNKVVSRFNTVEWPARSPDLTPLDFWLWGYLKAKVYSNPMPASLNDLQNRIVLQCRQMPQNMIVSAIQAMYERAQLCIQRRGHVVEGRM